MSTTERAARIGREHGTAAASWVFDGNTTDQTYATVLQGIDDGDPEILDVYRAPDLSGEYAGDYDETSLRSDLGYRTGDYAAEDMDDAANAYNDAASEAFWAEVERVAREHVEAARIEQLRSAGFPVTWADDSAVMDADYLLPYSHYFHNGPTSYARAYADLGSIARDEDTAGQSSTVDRSNYRSLVRDYPDVFTPIGYSNVNALGAFVANLPAGLVEILTGLREQYPLYDESDLSELESEEITESWAQYVQYEITRELQDSPDEGDRWDALTEDAQRDLFWSVVSDLGIYPEHDGLDIRWTEHYPAIAAEIYRRLAGK